MEKSHDFCKGLKENFMVFFFLEVGKTTLENYFENHFGKRLFFFVENAFGKNFKNVFEIKFDQAI